MVDALGWAAFVGGLVGTLVLMADRGFHDGLRLAWFLATLPAALTWEGIPHALRSIGAWPCVVLFTGAVLAGGWAARRWA